MKRKTMAIQSTNRRNGEMANTPDLKSGGLNGPCWFKSSLRHHLLMVLSKSKGLRLTSNGSKVYVWQGSKMQEGKVATRTLIGRECPAVSYVSSFFIQNFAGFLSGRIIYA